MRIRVESSIQSPNERYVGAWLRISHTWPEGVSASEYAMPEALVDRIISDHNRVAELERLVEEFIDATDAYAADQSGATDSRCGLVQPITVAEGERLNEVIARAQPHRPSAGVSR